MNEFDRFFRGEKYSDDSIEGVFSTDEYADLYSQWENRLEEISAPNFSVYDLFDDSSEPEGWHSLIRAALRRGFQPGEEDLADMLVTAGLMKVRFGGTLLKSEYSDLRTALGFLVENDYGPDLYYEEILSDINELMRFS